MKKINKILIANRGEIALRVIRSARESGVQTVAVYADQDRDSAFVVAADEAYALRGLSAKETYLAADKILEIATKSGADAIHPGYGFLSENADFADLVLASGLTWIGPPPSAIRSLGDKVSAREIAERVNAPLAAGTSQPIQSAADAIQFGEKHGYPIVIKAAHGGGGRGLRVVRTAAETTAQFESAVREASAAFGRGDCFVEKFLDRARHVETQCLADSNGKVVVISTRDCTLQRRHQKLIEEAPAPFLTSEQQAMLYTASKAILKEAGYLGAGTCEFLIGRDGEISFLEVNTRLQVEHPVSEEVTGIDLVREQIRIAEGEPIVFDDPVPNGHSVEFRINGEDAGNSFLPAPGEVKAIRWPSGPGVRIDSGISVGDLITDAFDSLLAKLIVWGEDRQAALALAKESLAQMEIDGLPTLIPFHRLILRESAFASPNGNSFGVHTRWIDEVFSEKIEPWVAKDKTELNVHLNRYSYESLVAEVDGRRVEIRIPREVLKNKTVSALDKPPSRRRHSDLGNRSGPGIILAPMQSTVVEVKLGPGSEVDVGDVICVLEAMKMEQPITTPIKGTVRSMPVESGQKLNNGDLIAEIVPRK